MRSTNPINFIAENQGSILGDITEDFPSYVIAGLGLTEFSNDRDADYPIVVIRSTDCSFYPKDDVYYDNLLSQIMDVVSTLKHGYDYSEDIPAIVVYLKDSERTAAIVLTATTRDGAIVEDDMGFSNETLHRKIRNYMNQIMCGEMTVEKIVGRLY